MFIANVFLILVCLASSSHLIKQLVLAEFPTGSIAARNLILFCFALRADSFRAPFPQVEGFPFATWTGAWFVPEISENAFRGCPSRARGRYQEKVGIRRGIAEQNVERLVRQKNQWTL